MTTPTLDSENLITRRVRVDRTRTPQEVLDATRRNQRTDKKVVAGMPRGVGDEVEVVFFKTYSYMGHDSLAEEYLRQGLDPADPYSLASVNEDDPTFADKYTNGTQWKDSEGAWCFALFYIWGSEYMVDVYRNVGYFGCRWFAGLRKISTQTSES